MKILIVDDHVVVREGVRRLLSTMSEVILFEASSTRDGLALFKSERPDLVLLDLSLSNSSGLELLRRLLLEDRDARILFLSMHTEPIYVARALEAGARGFVSKTASPGELLAAVQEVAGGGRYVERELAAQLVTSRYGRTDPLQKLTTRELDIARLLAEGQSFSTIAETLGVTYKTIANACSIIKSKLELERTSDVVRLIHHIPG
jgi:two-component system invasion response regulator UvrY